MGQLDTELEALEVRVLGGEVVLLGSRIAIALSASAAAETARRLAAAASLAMAAEPRADGGAGRSSSTQPSQTLPRDE